MKRALTFKRLTSIFVLAFTISILSFLVAKASFSTLPTALPDFTTTNYLRLSTIGDDNSTGANDYAPTISILVYKDASSVPGTAKLHFNSGDSCQGKTIQYASVAADDTGNKTSPDGLWHDEDSIISISKNDPTLSQSTIDPCKENIKIPQGAFKPSNRFGGTIQVAIVRIQLVSSGVFTFNIGRIDNNDRIRLSTIGFNSTESTDPNFPKSYGSLLKVRGGGSQIVAKFGVPCGFNKPGNLDPQGGQRKIFWKGADSQTGINPGKIGVNIQAGSGQTVVPDAGNGSDIKYAGPISMTAGDKFTVTFSGITNTNNAILLWLPFDSAAYDKDCSTGDNWKVDWTDGYIGRGGTVLDKTVGNLAIPDLPNSPEPGQTFNYVFDAENTGTRNISNIYYSKVCTNTTFNNSNPPSPWCARYTGSWTGYHYRAYSQYYHAVNLGYNPTFNTVPPDYLSFLNNTQTTPVTKYTTATPGGAPLYTNTGTGVSPGNSILTAGQRTAHSWGVSAGDGGKSFCVQLAVSPSEGTSNTSTGLDVFNDSNGQVSNNTEHTTSWNIRGSTSSSLLCVNVPFYYNLTPNVSVTGLQGGTVQQGTSPNVTASISQTGATNGRNNTYSEAGKQKGLLQLQLAPGEAEPSDKTAEALSTSDPTTWCKARTANNADCSTPYTSSSAVGVPGSPLSANLTGTLNPATDSLPVGTKLCYATFAQHPRNTESGDVGGAGDGRYSYSDIKCAIIVKSPKVQFLNSDVTVGRQSSAMAECSENQVADAPIITAGSPANRSPSNLYGSWVEYGAFATGKITNFGSAAVPFGTANEPRKLTFGNNDFNAAGELGGFVYGKNCVADFFSMVKEDNTNLNSLGGTVFDQTTGVLDMQQLGAGTDKTGYVATDKNIQLGEPTTGGPSAPDTTPAPTTQTIVKINARADSDMGTNGCPKLLVKVTDSDGNVDQDVKSICATGFQDYEYVFYQNTNGPKRVEARFMNDGIVANADRNIVLRSVTTNGQATYVSSRSSNPGSSITGGGTSCINGGNLYLYRTVSEGAPALDCFGITINPVTAPLPPAQQQADYSPPEQTTIIVTARATLASSSDGTSSVAGGCPYMYVKVTGTNGVVREYTQRVCSTSQSTYPFTVNMGGGGVSSVEASYDPADYYGGGQDRNLYISNVRVGTTSIPINANSGANVQLKKGTGGFVSIGAAPAACADNSTVIFLSATNNVTDTGCATVRVSNVTPPPPPAPTPPPSLTSDYEGFKGRSIVIYAKKTSAGACSSTSNGNITINKDLIYKKDGFASVLEIPRITIMADCNITIADNVVDVNANLIAGDAIKTCTDKAQTQDKCNQKLTVRGAISANRLLLWRTYGADNSPGAPDPQFPAETFDLSPSQIISGYSRGVRSAKPSTVYEVDLPPRY